MKPPVRSLLIGVPAVVALSVVGSVVVAVYVAEQAIKRFRGYGYQEFR